MIMVLRKLVNDNKDRMLYAAAVVLAANAGGAFSPIGDVTTIMLWNFSAVTSNGIIHKLFLPSLVSVMVPTLLLQYQLKGKLETPDASTFTTDEQDFTARQRKLIFCIGVGGLVFVPVFRYLTNLPPFVGILLILSLLWITTELFYRHLRKRNDDALINKSVSDLLSHIDMTTILFFLGILMSVSCLKEIGVLTMLGEGLDSIFHGNHYLVTGIIGFMSSIIDNVPLVAGCMGMYPIDAVGSSFAPDGLFWQLLAYCAGVGGSIFIIGSAAGVVAMGLERISFVWYMKRVSWLAFVGYLAGLGCYWIEQLFM